MQRIGPLYTPIDASLPLSERLESMVEQRARVLEAVTPIRRAAMANAVGSPQIERMLQQGHDILRQQVADVFAEELAAADAAPAGTGSSADELLDTLSAALAWPTWDTLRQWTPSQLRGLATRAAPPGARRAAGRGSSGLTWPRCRPPTSRASPTTLPSPSGRGWPSWLDWPPCSFAPTSRWRRSSPPLRERVILAVTEVNGCRYSAWVHEAWQAVLGPPGFAGAPTEVQEAVLAYARACAEAGRPLDPATLNVTLPAAAVRAVRVAVASTELHQPGRRGRRPSPGPAHRAGGKVGVGHGP